MARNLSFCENSVDEDYIDMEISSSTFFCYSITSPTKEFEFPESLERERTTSPADELFYNGKLLPLHLPPRVQTLQNLLQAANKDSCTTLSTTFNTPLPSCDISPPSDSCRVSRELIPADEYYFDCTNDSSSFIPKKSWSKKLKHYSSLTHKLKASRAYLKSLFSKSGCSDESCTMAAAAAAAGNGAEYRSVRKAKGCLNKYIKVANKNPFGQIQRKRYHLDYSADREKRIEEGGRGHRRSFSGAIKSSSTSFSLSSTSSSFSSSNSNELHLLKRSSSATTSDIESSVQGAIAHCKQSNQIFHSKKITNEQRLADSRIAAACEVQERPGLCRG